MPRVLLILFMFWAGLSSVNGKEAEAANEDVPKPPPGFSPGNLTNQKPSAPKTAGSGNGAAPKTSSGGGATTGAGKSGETGASRGR
jgi:hypothetical protein